MKKAKRLLAVLLAAVMLMSAACIPSYAYIDANNWHTPKTSNVDGYYMDYDQAAGYLLDLLDNMLGDLGLMITCDDLNNEVNFEIPIIGKVNIWTSNMVLNMDNYLEDAGAIHQDEGAILLNSVDNVIRSLHGLGQWVTNANLVEFADRLGVLGDLLDKTNGLGRLGSVTSLNYLRSNNNDTLVLEHVITIVAVGLGPILRDILGGSFDVGSLVSGLIDDLLKDFLGPNAALNNIGGALKDLLYSLLINSDADSRLVMDFVIFN